MHARSVPYAIRFLFGALAPAADLTAADFSWSGASPLVGGNNNMSNPANWSGGNAPPNTGGTADLIFSSITRTTPNADVNYAINTLRFTSTQAFTLGGNPITLQTDASVAPLIRNEASILNRINNNLTFSNSGTISAQTGNLTIGGVLGTGLVAGNTITLNAEAGRTLTFGSSIGGFGSLSKSGPGTVRFNALVANTGTITMGGGTMELSGQISGTSGINLTGGTIRLLANNRIPTVPFTMAGGTTLDFDGFTDEIGSLSGAGTIALGSGGLITINQTSSGTFSGVISGTNGAGLTKAGNGSLTLASTNGYNGSTTVAAGTLLGGANLSFSPASIHTVQSGATLALGGFDQIIGGLAGAGTVNLGNHNLTIGQNADTEFIGLITGSGSFTKAGLGAFRLTRANNYNGLTTVAAGRLVVTLDNALGSTNAGTTVLNGGTLELSNPDAGGGVSTVTIPREESITLAGPGADNLGALRVHAVSAVMDARVNGDIQLNGNSTIQTFTQPVRAARLTLGLSTDPGTLALNNHQLTFNGNATGEIDIYHHITGSGELIWDKSGPLRLRGTGTGHSGPLNILQGTVNLVNDTAITGNGGTVTVEPSARLALDFSGTGASITTSRTLDLKGRLTAAASATWNGTGNILLSPGLNIEASGSGTTLTLSGTGTITGNAQLNFDAATDSTIVLNRPVSLIGSNALRKTGGGTLRIDRAANYTGATLLEGGTILTGAGQVIPATSPVSLASSTTFDLNNFSQRVGGISGSGNVNLGSSTLTLNPATDMSHSGNIAGMGAIVIQGNGTAVQTFSSNNSYNGVTTIRNNGRLRALSSSQTLSSTAPLIIDSGGRFILEAPEVHVTNLNGGGTFEFRDIGQIRPILRIGGVSTSTWSGTIEGPGRLIKQGSQPFNASNATLGHTGETRITAGVFLLTNGTTIPNSPVVIEAGGRLAGNASLASVDVAGVIDPGALVNIPDTITTAQTTIQPGAIYECCISDWNSNPGVGNDLIHSTNVNFLANAANPLRINVIVPAEPANFSETQRVFKIITSSNFSGSYSPDAVDVRYVATPLALTGTWSTRLTGNDLELVYTPAGGDTYQTWIAGFNVGGQDAPDDDFDADGIPNAIEYVIGGNPQNVDDTNKLPISTVDNGNLVFVFRRTTRSVYLDPAVYHSTTLQAPWTKAVHASGGVTITTSRIDDDTDEVTVRIPMDGATRRFARLEVTAP